jgi:hypothetical protein
MCTHINRIDSSAHLEFKPALWLLRLLLQWTCVRTADGACAACVLVSAGDSNAGECNNVSLVDVYSQPSWGPATADCL